MKHFVVVLTIILGLFAGNNELTAKNRAYFYYVVVGVFEFKENADRYTSTINTEELRADYGFHQGRRYYYVFIYYHPDKTESALVLWAILASDKYKDKEMLSDAWVHGTDQIDHLTNNIPPPKPIVVVADNERPESVNFSNTPSIEEDTEKRLVRTVRFDEESPAETPEVPEKYHNLYLNTYSQNLDRVSAKVQLIDAEDNEYVGLVDAHKVLEIKQPNHSGKIKLTYDTFGYRERTIEINLEDPQNSDDGMFVEQVGDTLLVDFELNRYMAGDLVTVFKVYFFLDAALIKPESEEELVALRNMLRENPDYNIKLHGHTNTNASGKIVYPKDPETNFFNMDDNKVRVGKGSARELSLARANTVKRWLVAHGIDENRISTQGWGAIRLLYPKNSDHADKNVRVEVEILKD